MSEASIDRLQADVVYRQFDCQECLLEGDFDVAKAACAGSLTLEAGNGAGFDLTYVVHVSGLRIIA